MGMNLQFLTTVFFRVDCPRCEARMPVIRRPNSPRQVLLGGWTCHQCGCEMDRTGRAIDIKGETVSP
jgi:transposase-like protein